MKRNGILNSDISRVLSYLGHTDCICIGDCGLPIPDEVERIDLALAFGEPTFMRTLEVVVGDMKVEKIVLAEEIKEKNPDVKIIAVEPAASPLLSEGRAGGHGLQGIGANFVPSILDRSVIDEIVTVKEEDAYAAGRLMASSEGTLVGITAGAALHAAMTIGSRPENQGKNVVAFLPDTGDRYLSTPLFGK